MSTWRGVVLSPAPWLSQSHFVICLSVILSVFNLRDSVPIEEVNICLAEVDMATASEKVKIEDIDLVLRDAQVCNAQLNFLHHLLNEPNVDEKRSADIESKCATIFRDMVSNLYSVLDQIYYYLYCHYQNNGNVLFSNAAFRIKQPIKQDLKWSEDDTRDGQPECKKKRNDWVTDQWMTIFGGVNFPESKRHVVRLFQNNLLRMQAIRKVDQSGQEVLGPNGGPTLLRVVSIEHGAAGNLSQFNPSSLEVEDLKSVSESNFWNDTVGFNLLHFFRNFTAHRSLIACKIKKGYLNLETRKFESADQHLPEPWILIAKGSWILVPELSHLREVGRVISPTFHPHPLLVVCSSLLTFVKNQRHNMLLVLDHIDHIDYPYVVNWFLDGFITFEKNHQFLGKCRWEEAQLWPVITS